MAAAILTKYIVFTDPTNTVKYMVWYIREISTAMIVNNLAMCYPLGLKIFRVVKTQVETGSRSFSESASLKHLEASQAHDGPSEK